MDSHKYQEKQGDRAYANHTLLSELCQRGELYDLEKGRVLYEIHQDKQFQVLGYDTFDAYIAQPELGMSRSTAYLYKDLWKTYVVELQVQPEELVGVGVANLRKIKAHTTKENVRDLLNLASQLSKSDLNEELAERFGEETKPKKSNRLYMVEIDTSMYGVDYYFLVRAEDREEANQKGYQKYMEDYLADPEMVDAGKVDPQFSDIELDKQGVSKPIAIYTNQL
jgi:hypothetical protein